jgi:hypothetical protein
MGRVRQQVQTVADSPYAGMATSELFADNPYKGTPRYDSRYARRYARNILMQAGFFAELDEELRDMRRDGRRSDAGLSMAFARSLEYIIRKPYEAEYPELRAAEFIPLMTEVPPEAASFTYRMLDKMGQAAIIQENGNDAPKVDIKGEEWQQPIVTIGASYDYTILDTMRASRMGVPLEAYKAEAARFACEYLMENLAAVGNSNYGLAGLTNAPNITATTQVSIASGSWVQQANTLGAASTLNAQAPAVAIAQGIVSDILAMKKGIFVDTQGIHQADLGLVTVSGYAALMSTPRSPAFTDDTLLDWLEKVCQIQIECWPQLNSAGAITVGGLTGRVMVYKRDPKILNLVLAQPFTQLPPQPSRMSWEVVAYLRTGAVQVRYPRAVRYMDGVC